MHDKSNEYYKLARKNMRNLKRILNTRLIRKPQILSTLRHRILSASGHKPILIYTMGKVVSSTEYHSIKNSRISRLTYHVHVLSQYNINRISKKYDKAGVSDPRFTIRQVLSGEIDHLTSSLVLTQIPHEKTWYILTIVRDPVATFLSHLFQNP